MLRLATRLRAKPVVVGKQQQKIDSQSRRQRTAAIVGLGAMLPPHIGCRMVTVQSPAAAINTISTKEYAFDFKSEARWRQGRAQT